MESNLHGLLFDGIYRSGFPIPSKFIGNCNTNPDLGNTDLTEQIGVYRLLSRMHHPLSTGYYINSSGRVGEGDINIWSPRSQLVLLVPAGT